MVRRHNRLLVAFHVVTDAVDDDVLAGHGDRDRLLCRGMSRQTAKQQWRFTSGSNTGAASDSIRSRDLDHASYCR